MDAFLKIHFKIIAFSILLFLYKPAYSEISSQLIKLQKAYPDHIQSINNKYITWRDGTKMPLEKPNTANANKLDAPSMIDQINNMNYIAGKPLDYPMHKPTDDPGRVRHTPFFQKIYGNSKEDVENNLTTIYWLPRIFGDKYPIKVTKINSVAKKLKSVSDDLELLALTQPKFLVFLDHPSGGFTWRNIRNTQRISPHSFGIAIDLNTETSDYWQNELEKNNKPISENINLNYQNKVPWEIVSIFEKHGFIWGGKWYHYDTMHFEYRPELL